MAKLQSQNNVLTEKIISLQQDLSENAHLLQEIHEMRLQLQDTTEKHRTADRSYHQELNEKDDELFRLNELVYRLNENLNVKLSELTTLRASTVPKQDHQSSIDALNILKKELLESKVQIEEMVFAVFPADSINIS